MCLISFKLQIYSIIDAIVVYSVSSFSRHTVRRSLVVESVVLGCNLPLTMGNVDYVSLATEI